MNIAIKASPSVGGHNAVLYSLRAISSFHSTPVLERKRKTFWNSGTRSYKAKRFNSYAKRMGRIESKRTTLCDISDYAEHLFESWNEGERNKFTSNGSTAWFRKQCSSKGGKPYDFSSNESQWGSHGKKRNGGFDFCFSDDEETIFPFPFGVERGYYWSFNSSDNFQWRTSSGRTSRRSSWNWRDESDYEDEETDMPSQSHLVPERLALGLHASGPLKLEEVKSAYRACALRWHPDRHQGSSKVAAEEKFKHCSAAYTTLCEKLVIN